MDERKTIGDLKNLLQTLERDWPDIKEFKEWPRLRSLVNEAKPSAAVTNEVAEASMKLVRSLESLSVSAPGVGALCERLRKGGITPPAGPCEKIRRTIKDVAGPALRGKPL